MTQDGGTPNDVPDFTGVLIAGKYRVRRLVGVGGMGVVWEGHHEVLGTRVAVKFIKPSYAEQPEARARFQIEARAAAMLHTRHAVQVHDYGATEWGVPYIVMEFLEGEPLSDRLMREGPLPAAEAAQVIGQAARALAKAHAAGVVHRDLKPDNIFLARQDDAEGGLPYTVKVVDFGIAKILETGQPIVTGPLGGPTAAGTVVGTPNFMSPEQLTVGGPPTPLSDLWSLGACAFTAVTARLPFDGDVLGDIVLKVCSAPLPAPSKLNPSLPNGFDAWFFRACARDPQKRFQSADELATSLAAACGLTPVRVATLDEDQVQYVLKPREPLASIEDLPEPSAMSPRTALLAGLVIGAALMVGVAGLVAYRSQMESEAAGAAPAPTTAPDGGARDR